MTTNRPVGEFKEGGIRLSIWQRPDRTYTFSVSKRYKDGDVWKDSKTFFEEDADRLMKLCGQYKSWIQDQKHMESQEVSPEFTDDDIPF